MATKVVAHITGKVWQVDKQVGDLVEEGEVVVVLESMKMEVPVEAPVAGTVSEVLCAPGDEVAEGASLMLIA